MVQQKKIYTKDKDEKLILQHTPVNQRVEVSSKENHYPVPVDEIFLYAGSPGGRMMSVLNAWWGEFVFYSPGTRNRETSGSFEVAALLLGQDECAASDDPVEKSVCA